MYTTCYACLRGDDTRSPDCPDCLGVGEVLVDPDDATDIFMAWEFRERTHHSFTARALAELGNALISLRHAALELGITEENISGDPEDENTRLFWAMNSIEEFGLDLYGLNSLDDLEAMAFAPPDSEYFAEG